MRGREILAEARGVLWWRTMRSTRLSLSCVIVLCVTIVAATGCSTRRPGFAFSSKASTLGVYPASQSMTKKYGIVAWHLFLGRKQMVVTGYGSDGKPRRGVQLSWYTTSSGMPGHTKVTMLDGSGASIRRMVGGAVTGHFSADQKIFLDTIRYDMMRATHSGSSGATQGASFGGLHAQDVGLGGGAGGSHVLDVSLQPGSTPNTGPDCQQAELQQAEGGSAFGCALDVGGLIIMPEGAAAEAAAEATASSLSAANSCWNWYLDSEHTKSVCDTENTTDCTTDGSCEFPDQPTQSASDPSATPQQQCDTQCLCANFPETAQGCSNASGSCSDSDPCPSGDTCQSGSCQPPSSDPLTDQNTSINNDSAPSCGSGDVSTDPSNGDVGCGDTSGGTSGGGSGATDPGGDTSGGSGGGSGSGDSNLPTDYCAQDGDSCGGPADCCSGSCVAGVCGGQCLNDGDSCVDDTDCCTGSCSGGICGGGGNGATCANDGDPCSADSDCCGGTCDTSSWTCGTGGGGNTCGNPGDPCGGDSDCCSSSCDPDYFYCN